MILVEFKVGDLGDYDYSGKGISLLVLRGCLFHNLTKWFMSEAHHRRTVRYVNPMEYIVLN